MYGCKRFLQSFLESFKIITIFKFSLSDLDIALILKMIILSCKKLRNTENNKNWNYNLLVIYGISVSLVKMRRVHF